MKIKYLFDRIITFPFDILHIKRSIEQSKFLSAKILHRMNMTDEQKILANLQLSEFKVFSQWGDDGIIQFLIDYLEIKNQQFIEFGVENYREANTRYLLMNNNWRGLIFDASPKNIRTIKNDEIYWKHELTAVQAFITQENINDLILENDFSGEIGLLHIDIDGNDYWIWNQITAVNPIIVIMEYNSVFGIDYPWTIPYHPKFFRTDYHHSNLYFGASLLALCDMAETKGYSFVACNSNGNNAYFVKKTHLKDLKPLTPQQGFVNSKIRESRNLKKNLTFISGKQRILQLKGMKIYNTRTKSMDII